MEAVLLDPEGKRLMLEAIYHYGVMLLLLDRLIPSIARERIVTCYVRYKDTAMTVERLGLLWSRIVQP